MLLFCAWKKGALWMLGEAIADGSPVGTRRRSECRRLKPLDPICPIDMAFHPNRKGARAYADAVIQVTFNFLTVTSRSNVPGVSRTAVALMSVCGSQATA